MRVSSKWAGEMYRETGVQVMGQERETFSPAAAKVYHLPAAHCTLSAWILHEKGEWCSAPQDASQDGTFYARDVAFYALRVFWWRFMELLGSWQWGLSVWWCFHRARIKTAQEREGGLLYLSFPLNPVVLTIQCIFLKSKRLSPPLQSLMPYLQFQLLVSNWFPAICVHGMFQPCLRSFRREKAIVLETCGEFFETGPIVTLLALS